MSDGYQGGYGGDSRGDFGGRGGGRGGGRRGNGYGGGGEWRNSSRGDGGGGGWSNRRDDGDRGGSSWGGRRDGGDRGGGGGGGNWRGGNDADAVTMTVDSHLVGRIIGKGGSKIRELQDQSGTRIKVSNDDATGEGLVVITGSPDAQEKAKELIQEVINREY